MKEIVRVKCIKHRYEDKTEVEVCGLSFIVKRGEKVVLMGPNGSGKTTLLNHIIGFLKPVSGEIKVFGVDPSKHLKEIVRKIGVVFQNVDEQLIGPTVYDDIAFTPLNLGWKRERVEEKVNKIIKLLKIDNLKNRVPHYLSGGEKKKVAIAGAMVHEPELLVLDEPFTELDIDSKNRIMSILKELNKEKNVSIIIATNDVNIAIDFADTIYLMKGGKISFKGTPDKLKKRKIKYEVCEH